MGQASGKAPISDASGNPTNADEVVVEACSVEDMKNGEMREIQLETTKALLVKSEDKFYCIGNKCSHFGAPLSKGVACNGIVRCPWHGACFNLSTGDIEEFPGLDSIPTYMVDVKEGKVYIRTPRANLSVTKRVKPMVSGCPNDDMRLFLIVGGGPAAVTCAEALRQECFPGQVVIASMDTCLPYDRTKLSKAMKSVPTDIALRANDFYEKYGIDVRTNKKVVLIDFEKKIVNYENGSSQGYSKLMLALGCQPCCLSIPGSDLANVFTLRSLSDANLIAQQSVNKNVVIVGSSFIGMELAMYFSDKASSVTVIARDKAPFVNVFGERVGVALQKLHESKGVKFVTNSGITEINGTDGSVSAVTLTDGSKLDCDSCILAIGAKPATEFLKSSSLELNQAGYIVVDKHMKTNIDDVYAAGDCVEFPLAVAGKNVSIGHWQMALNHGRAAGYNMVGRTTPVTSVPYFWTVMYGKSVRYTGYSHGYDDLVIHGEPDDLKFVAFYLKGENVIAVSSLNYDPIVSQVAAMFSAGLTISKSEIVQDPQSWTNRLPPP